MQITESQLRRLVREMHRHESVRLRIRRVIREDAITAAMVSATSNIIASTQAGADAVAIARAGSLPEADGSDTNVETQDDTRQLARVSAEGDPALQSFIKVMLRARERDLTDLAKLWSGMAAVPGDFAAARDLADALGLEPALASFHARKMRTGTDYPAGEELRELVLADRQGALQRRVAARQQHKPPEKPYGGGSRQRPWDRST
jgi:hypothetical protein